MQQANKLSEQMNGNLKARETYKLLFDYPPREYPEPEPLDAKGKPLKKDPKAKPVKKKRAHLSQRLTGQSNLMPLCKRLS